MCRAEGFLLVGPSLQRKADSRLPAGKSYLALAVCEVLCSSRELSVGFVLLSLLQVGELLSLWG